MLKISSSIFFFLLVSCCSVCSAQPEIKRYVSFVEQSDLIKSTIRTYELYRKADQFYLMVTRGVESNRTNVIIYDIADAKKIASFEDETDFLDSVEKAVKFLESLGFDQVRPIKSEMTAKTSPMSHDGYRSYDLGAVNLVTDKNNTCSSSFSRSFSIWDSSGKLRLNRMVPLVISNVEHIAVIECEKMYGHQSEKLEYMGLEISKVWPIDESRFGVSFSSIDTFFILHVSDNGTFYFDDVRRLSFLDYEKFSPLYSKYYSNCFVNSASSPTTLDACISSSLKDDKIFQQLLKQ